jgi:hypothetical protein
MIVGQQKKLPLFLHDGAHRSRDVPGWANGAAEVKRPDFLVYRAGYGVTSRKDVPDLDYIGGHAVHARPQSKPLREVSYLPSHIEPNGPGGSFHALFNFRTHADADEILFVPWRSPVTPPATEISGLGGQELFRGFSFRFDDPIHHASLPWNCRLSEV